MSPCLGILRDKKDSPSVSIGGSKSGVAKGKDKVKHPMADFDVFIGLSSGDGILDKEQH